MKKLGIVLCVALLVLGFTGMASAGVIGFQDDTVGSAPLLGVDLEGNVTVETGPDFTVTDGPIAAEGENFLYLTTGPGETGAGISAYDRDGDGNNENDVALVSIGFLAPEDTTISLDYDVLTSEITEGVADIFEIRLDGVTIVSGAIGVASGSFPAVTGFSGDEITGPDTSYFVDGRLGWNTLSGIVVTSSGVHSLEFYVGDSDDAVVDTALLVDNITITLPAGVSVPRIIGTSGYGDVLSTLVELDPMTGTIMKTIGPVGYVVNGLDYDATTGKLYASTAVKDPSYNGLIEINLTTGSGTPVGVHGWGLGDTYGPGGDAAPVTNITVDSAGNMFGWYETGDDLVSIDKSTGEATVVGESGVGTETNGLDFDDSDTLYMVNEGGSYYTVDTATGAATYVDTIGTTAHHGNFDPLFNLWVGLSTEGSPRRIVAADLATGEAGVGPEVGDLHTIAFAPPPAAPAPPPPPSDDGGCFIRTIK